MRILKIAQVLGADRADRGRRLNHAGLQVVGLNNTGGDASITQDYKDVGARGHLGEVVGLGRELGRLAPTVHPQASRSTWALIIQ